MVPLLDLFWFSFALLIFWQALFIKRQNIIKNSHTEKRFSQRTPSCRSKIVTGNRDKWQREKFGASSAMLWEGRIAIPSELRQCLLEGGSQDSSGNQLNVQGAWHSWHLRFIKPLKGCDSSGMRLWWEPLQIEQRAPGNRFSWVPTLVVVTQLPLGHSFPLGNSDKLSWPTKFDFDGISSLFCHLGHIWTEQT